MTDCDRLDCAFAALNEHGIVARQYFSCCKNDGQADILDEIEVARANAEDNPVIGYAFYSEADADAALRYGRLNISYAAVDYSEERTLAVGRAVVAALEAKGLEVVWDEDTMKRIHLPSIVWHRRAPLVVPQ